MSKHRLIGPRVPVPRAYRHHRPAHRAYVQPLLVEMWHRLAWPFVGPSRRILWQDWGGRMVAGVRMGATSAVLLAAMAHPVDFTPRQGVESPPSARRHRRPE